MIKHRYAIALIALSLGIAFPAPLAAASHGAGIARHIRKAANGQVWMEQTLWGLHDQEGGWIGARIANKDGSHDLGPLQINSWWVPRIASMTGRTEREISYWLRYDASFNVETAKWIFLSGLAASHDYWRAIGIYHSPSPARQRAYAHKVALLMQRRFGPQLFTKARSRPWPETRAQTHAVETPGSTAR